MDGDNLGDLWKKATEIADAMPEAVRGIFFYAGMALLQSGIARPKGIKSVDGGVQLEVATPAGDVTVAITGATLDEELRRLTGQP